MPHNRFMLFMLSMALTATLVTPMAAHASRPKTNATGPVEEEVAERFFAPDEVTRLRSLPRAQQTQAFFACWTRKEAYVKAIGDGLLLPLDSFSVSLEPDAPAQLLRAGNDPLEPFRWQFHHFVSVPGMVGAIAARRCFWRVRRLPPET